MTSNKIYIYYIITDKLVFPRKADGRKNLNLSVQDNRRKICKRKIYTDGSLFDPWHIIFKTRDVNINKGTPLSPVHGVNYDDIKKIIL